MEPANNGQTMPDWRYAIVKNKNAAFDGVFCFAVRTTGIFCRPSCSSRTPKPENVTFFESPGEAAAAGFRACLRCRPESEFHIDRSAALTAEALKALRDREREIATIEELAGRLKISTGHLQKVFNAVLGLTPKEVMDIMRIENFKENVRKADVTTSLYESGFGSSRSLYEKAAERLGMTPATYKKGGKGTKIIYTIADSPLGKMLIAATDRGICAVSFGDTDEALQRELKAEFFAAEIGRDDTILTEAVDAIRKAIDGERSILTLPLDISGTAFQMRVWSELRKIPFGETRSYAEVAGAIGKPKAVRAVARACATNPVAIVNPCHRVIASDGKLSGYRWGIERKAKLLKQEKGCVE
jgi:AraC family transcriptional regulator of adaptative response/methylated-DNA-[protein]-cysteine methyltransferase